MASIIQSECDVCGAKGAVALRLDFNDMPLAVMCRLCDPKLFDHIALQPETLTELVEE